MSGQGSHSNISDEDLGRVMGISRYLNLSFTEKQVRALVEAIEAGANPTALVEWLRQVEKSKNEATSSSQPVVER